MARSKSLELSKPALSLSMFLPQKPTTIHKLWRHKDLSDKPFRIDVAGAGGTGSQMISKLARIHRALKSFGLPGLDVVLFDDDLISDANVGRQLFYPSEIGQYKATSLIARANIGFGLNWRARTERYKCQWLPGQEYPSDMVITCTDTGKSRWDIFQAACELSQQAPVYWLDIGNKNTTGQVWIGNFPGVPVHPGRMITVAEKYPEEFDGTYPEDKAPSCSLAEALLTQDLFINDFVANQAADLLWHLLKDRKIQYQGYWINLGDSSVKPMPIEMAKSMKPDIRRAA